MPKFSVCYGTSNLTLFSLDLSLYCQTPQQVKSDCGETYECFAGQILTLHAASEPYRTHLNLT